MATATGLARPTARRLLLTLEELGYVRSDDGTFELTPKVITLGTAYVASLGLWEVARPHLETLVRHTGESSSMAQLDGSRHRLRRAGLGAEDHRPPGRHRHPLPGPADLAGQGPPRRPVAPTISTPSSRSRPGPGSRRYIGTTRAALDDELTQVRARGWALADEELAPGVRSVAVPVRDGTGTVRAAMNVTVHAAETTHRAACSTHHLPLLLRAAGDVSADWALWQSRPHAQVQHHGTDTGTDA